MTANIIHFDPAKASNLSMLSTAERNDFYIATCQSLHLNPLTRPLEFIVLNGKLTLYCLKEGAAQLRHIHKVSLSIVSMHEDGNIFTVHVKARTADGKEDEDVGCVTLPASGDARCNAIMKAITKAKRRVTLSVCGLGLLDETEIETVPAAAKQTVAVDDSQDQVAEIEVRRAAVKLQRSFSKPSYVKEPPQRALKRAIAAQRNTGPSFEAKIEAETTYRRPKPFQQPLVSEINPPEDYR